MLTRREILTEAAGSRDADRRYLYQMMRGLRSVAAFRIEANGALTQLGTVTGGLPVNNGISGLAAY